MEHVLLELPLSTFPSLSWHVPFQTIDVSTIEQAALKALFFMETVWK